MVEAGISSDVVPIVENLDRIYDLSNPESKIKQITRYRRISACFEESYGLKPAYFSRAPGRVNLIGEHIDYCGYPVMPAAIEQDMIMAFALNNTEYICITHMNSDIYKPIQLTISQELPFFPLEDIQNRWANYFIAAVRHIIKERRQFIGEKLKGFSLVMDSSVPLAAGVSSSSAFSVCSTLVPLMLYAQQHIYTRADMIENIINYERSVGLAGGGMDQTIALYAHKSTAKLIHFIPKITLQTVTLPTNALLVVANSLAISPKISTLGTRYTKRVVECRLGMLIIGLCMGVISKEEVKGKPKFLNFLELQKKLGKNLEDMLVLVEIYLELEAYTVEKLESILEGKLEEILGDIQNVDIVLKSNTEYKLHDRAKHVFSEALRVYQVDEICKKEVYPEQIKDIGQLMNESHYSCRDLYECSSPELEELTILCRKEGAIGSRLTGGGWGGCCISILNKENEESFINKVQSYFTKEREVKLEITQDLSSYLFATNFGSGAAIILPKAFE